MNDYLISRKKLVEKIYNYFSHKDTTPEAHFAYGIVLVEINAMQTAFDKEKVIEQLQKCSHNYYPSIDHYCLSKKAVDLKDAIDIVQRGGIS